MKNLVKFILVGLLFSAYPGEIANQIIVHRTLQGFAGTMAIYFVLFIFGYFISKLFKRKLIPSIAYFILFGTIGLLIEYFIISQGPEAYATGMFTFWATIFMMPRIFIDDSGYAAGLKRKIMKYLLISAPIVLAVFLIPPRGPEGLGNYLGIHVFMVQVMVFYIFYIQYFIYLFSRANAMRHRNNPTM